MTALILLLLKTLLIFAAAGLTLFALRRASAAARHLVCLLTLAALLALPILSGALPGWQMLPSFISPGSVSATVSPLAPTSGGIESPTPALSLKQHGDQKKAPDQSLSFSRRGSREATGEVSPLFPWTSFFLAIYALGILCALTRPLLGLWGIRQLSHVSVPLAAAPAQVLAAECCAVLHLTCRPVLRQAAVSVPMTWGSARPVVLLPLGAEKWPEDRLRAVLLHELAHIKRRDWLGHRFADIVCALYWFHPLVWLTARRLRTESEAACDDLVLASGMAAPEYARHLLEIARALPPVSVMPQAVIAMAQTSQVESRLKMILNTTQSRRQITRRVLLAVISFSIVALVSLAMLRPAAKAALNLGRMQQVGNLPVDLVGVTGQPGREPRWWRANGTMLSNTLTDVRDYHIATMFESPIFKNCLVAFRLPQTAHDVTTTYFVPRSVGWSSQGTWTNKMRATGMQTEAELNASTGGYRLVTLTFPAASIKANVQVGVASGHWTTAVVENYWRTGKQYPSSEVGQATDRNGERFVFCPATETKDKSGTKLIIKTDNRLQDIRIVAVDKQGRIVLPSSIGDQSNGTRGRIQAYFPLHHAQVKEFRVETRPFVWTEFKNVALQPVK